jgi:hypothetical protein
VRVCGRGCVGGRVSASVLGHLSLAEPCTLNTKCPLHLPHTLQSSCGSRFEVRGAAASARPPSKVTVCVCVCVCALFTVDVLMCLMLDVLDA